MWSYFEFLAVMAALKVTCQSIISYISYNVVIRVLYVVIINVTDDLDAVFATLNIPQLL